MISTEFEDYAIKKAFLIYLGWSSVLFRMSHMFISLSPEIFVHAWVVIILICATLYIDYFISMRNGLSITIVFIPGKNWSF
jgi:hypothetical protein